jgi:hypothetical protein
MYMRVNGGAPLGAGQASYMSPWEAALLSRSRQNLHARRGGLGSLGAAPDWQGALVLSLLKLKRLEQLAGSTTPGFTKLSKIKDTLVQASRSEGKVRATLIAMADKQLGEADDNAGEPDGGWFFGTIGDLSDDSKIKPPRDARVAFEAVEDAFLAAMKAVKKGAGATLDPAIKCQKGGGTWTGGKCVMPEDDDDWWGWDDEEPAKPSSGRGGGGYVTPSGGGGRGGRGYGGAAAGSAPSAGRGAGAPAPTRRSPGGAGLDPRSRDAALLRMAYGRRGAELSIGRQRRGGMDPGTVAGVGLAVFAGIGLLALMMRR